MARLRTVRALTIRAGIFLLLGAVLNVAIAWMCAVAAPQPPQTPGEVARQNYSDLIGYPIGWPEQNNVISSGFRLSYVPRRGTEWTEDGIWLA